MIDAYFRTAQAGIARAHDGAVYVRIKLVVPKSRCMQKVGTQQRCSVTGHHETLEVASHLFGMIHRHVEHMEDDQ